jgi:hypothetical protein
MLTSLTDEQKIKMVQHRDEYLDFILNNHRSNPDNLQIPDVRENINWIYEYLGFKPPKYIFFADSYLQEKMMINFILYGGLDAMINMASTALDNKPLFEKSNTVIKDITTGLSSAHGFNNPAVPLVSTSMSVYSNIWYQVKNQIKDSFIRSRAPSKDKKSTAGVNKIDFSGLQDMVSSLWHQVQDNNTLEKIEASKTLTVTSLSSEILRDVAKQVSQAITTNTWAQAWSPLRQIIRDQIHTNIKNPIENRLENQLYDNTEFDYKAIQQQLNALMDTINLDKPGKNSLDLLVVIDATIKFMESFSSINTEGNLKFVEQNFGVTQDIWLSFYSFFKKIGVLNDEKFDKYYSFMKKGIWSAQFFQDWCIITQLPKRISRDPQTRLHSTDGPVLEWRNRGYKIQDRVYYIHGINFTEETWDKIVTNKITIGEILQITNMEQRQAMLSVISPKKFIQEFKGTLISTHTQEKKGREYMVDEKNYDTLQHKKIELYRVDDVSKLNLRQPLFVLLYSDPSTSREYFLFVNPRNAVDAASAMASTLGLTKEQYINITAET